MKRRRLGSQDRLLDVSALGLGCMGLSFAYGSIDESRGIRTIQRALDLGITFLDTADVYGPESNERLIARAIANRRGEVQLATKFGIAYGDPDRAVDGRPEYVRQSCEGSLRRLNVDSIDLYYLHRVDAEVPIEDTVGAMVELVEAGKIRHIGLSEAAPETIRRAHALYPITAVQSEYSLWTRDVEKGGLAVLRELGIGFVPYSPLGRGFLSGKITSPDDLEENDWRRTNPRFQGENFNQNLQLVKHVQQVAEQLNLTAAQVALAWVLQQGDDVVPIPGTSNPERVQENAAAVEVELSDSHVKQLEQAFPQDAAAGTRYTPEGMKLVQR